MAIETITTLDFGVLFNPIFKFIIALFAVVGGYSILKDLINAISRCFKDKLDYKKDCLNIEKDCELMHCLSKKETRLITVENAQEIHELNKKYAKIKEDIDFLMEKVNGK